MTIGEGDLDARLRAAPAASREPGAVLVDVADRLPFRHPGPDR
ncbi:MAG TPA: hypothetical protein VMD59_00260 [Acidimicrobiales bacterium]|nr:hypothetical protein [Acidimicrobiales bacterium]